MSGGHAMQRRSPVRWAAVILLVILGLGFATNLRAAGLPAPAATLQAIIGLVESYYRRPVAADDLWRGAIRGALEALGDPHTSYMGPDEFKAFQDDLEGRLVGIGVTIEVVGRYITVVSPIRGSPAEKAGLKAGDRILEADGESLVGVSASEAAGRIRGEAGTRVTLKIERPSEGRVFEVTVTRAPVQIPVVESEPVGGGIGLIRIHSFSEVMPERFDEAYRALAAAGLRGLIVDVRDNPGGLLDSAVELAGRFIGRGEPVVREVGQDGSQQVVRSPGAPEPVRVPVVVLVNEGSASASEIFAGALQDYGIATLVGTRTFGKGSIQRLFDVPGGGVLKLTVAEYRTPKGRVVDGQGLVPDVEVKPLKPDPERTRPLTFTRVLGLRSVGLDVLAVQQRLNDLGFPRIAEDGVYGPGTEAAVRAFQKAAGLPVTGTVDEATLRALEGRVAQHAHDLAARDVQKEKAVEILRQKIAGAAA